MLGRVYLVVFNAVLCAGWAQVLATLVQSSGPCEAGDADDAMPGWMPVGHGILCVWKTKGSIDEVFGLLKLWQIFSLLEVVHAAVGLVGAKVMTTLLQVVSRIFIVWMIMIVVPTSPTVDMRTSFWLMSIAWSVTEVIRYSWYALKEATGFAPFPLTWCRYTFFYVLYPIGVYGELCLAWAAQATPSSGGPTRASLGYKWAVRFIMALYAPIFPMLYMHMITQRKKTLSAPKAAPPPKKERGLVFPKEVYDAATGKRSTTVAGAKIIAAALRNAGESELADAAERAGKKWRFAYLKHFTKMVYASCKSADKALKIAAGGSEWMHNNFGFVDADGNETMFSEYMKKHDGAKTSLHVGVIKGKAKTVPKSWKVPYPGGSSDATLEGDELAALLDSWASAGTIEPDCAEAIKAATSNSEWMDLRGHTFVLIGAGSAMGPFPKLMELGATVVAIDIPGKWGARPTAMWKRLIETAEASPGVLIVPLDQPQKECGTGDELYKHCGCNLTESPADILSWLRLPSVAGAPNERVTIGNYTYLDGDLHVLLSLCADAIIKGLIETKGKLVTVAFLCTPTDLHVIPKEAWDAAKSNSSPFRIGWPVEMLLKALFGLKHNTMKPAKADDGSDVYLVDGIAVAQGPNYALAKRLQHWRAMLAYEAGCTVSSSIAPSTATASVVSNITFKWAYGGMPYFKPYYIFNEQTTNAVMAALLVHDVRNSNGSKNPVNRSKFGIRNPLEIFSFQSCHGGVWRAGYTVDSIGTSSVVIYFLGGPSMIVPVVYAAVGGVCYWLQTPAFLQSEIVTDAKFVLFGE